MRAPLPLTDSAMVLLDRIPMARQAGPLGTGAIRPTFDRVGADRVDRGVDALRRPPTAAPRRASSGDDEPSRIRGNGIEQLDLDPDDRVDPGRLGRPCEPDDAVEAEMIRCRQARQAELDRTLDELVGRGGAVEKREV